jgi:hypothetical protein
MLVCVQGVDEKEIIHLSSFYKQNAFDLFHMLFVFKQASCKQREWKARMQHKNIKKHSLVQSLWGFERSLVSVVTTLC